MLWMLAQVDHRRRGSVRHAEQVEAWIPEPSANLIQVIHRDRRRVVARVVFLLQLSPPAATRREKAALVAILGARGIRGQIALQRVGRSGPPLIDQEDVTLPSQIGIRLAQEARIAGGWRDSPAGEEDQGIRSDLRTLRRKHDDVEPDLSTFAGGAVLIDLVPAAADLLGHTRHMARLELSGHAA